MITRRGEAYLLAAPMTLFILRSASSLARASGGWPGLLRVARTPRTLLPPRPCFYSSFIPNNSHEHSLTSFLVSTELRSSDHTSTRRLLSSQLSFQGPSLPPSNACVPNSLPQKGNYYPALRGRTRFAFAFELPPTSPSSCVLGQNATTRYELRAFASSLFKGEVDIRSEKIEVKVVENWKDWRKGRWRDGAERGEVGKLKMAGDGKLEVRASVGTGEEGGQKGRLFWRRSGESGEEGNARIDILVQVKNGSKRNVSPRLCLLFQ